VIRTPETSVEFVELGKNIFNQLIALSLVAISYKVALSIRKLMEAGAQQLGIAYIALEDLN
jgi:uncharacterized membrane protein YadS